MPRSRQVYRPKRSSSTSSEICRDLGCIVLAGFDVYLGWIEPIGIGIRILLSQALAGILKISAIVETEAKKNLMPSTAI